MRDASPRASSATPAASPQAATWLRWCGLNAAVALAYAVLGLAALQLIRPPDFSTPIFPAAGLAVAAVLRWGAPVLPGVMAGSLLMNLVFLGNFPQFPLGPLGVAVGTALQAYIGARLAWRWVGHEPRLTEPRELLRFFAAIALIACTIGPTIGMASLWFSGAIAPTRFAQQWFGWWSADAIGVMIGTPVALSLFGVPRAHWAPRRLGVALPLVVACVLLSAAGFYVARNEETRAHRTFEREAENALEVLNGALQRPLAALEANHSLLMVAPGLSRADFERAHAERASGNEAVYSLGWAARLSVTSRVPFEHAAQEDGYVDYRIHERHLPGDLTLDPGEDIIAIRLIVPFERNRAALGINVRSVPQSRAAQDNAIASGLQQASEGFQLAQDTGSRAVGVVVYRAVYTDGQRHPGATPVIRGLAFAALRPEGLLREAMPTQALPLDFCLQDLTPGTHRALLAGEARCAALPGSLPERHHDLTYAGRLWRLTVYAPAGLPMLPGDIRVPFALAGLVCTGLLGVLLLLVTGRAARVRQLVDEATDRLRESEERFRNIVDAAPMGVVVADLNGRPQTVNPYFCQLVGYSARDLKQGSIMKITHADDRTEDSRLSGALIRGELDRYSRIKRYISGQGALITVRVWVSLLKDAQGQPFRLVGVVEDIGEQLRLEELERLHETEHAAHRAKNDFLSRMSHELRTPLNAMLGFSQLLEADREPAISPRQRGWVSHIQQSGWHLLEMINDTLDMSRLEADQIRVEINAQSLPPLMADSLAMVETQRYRRQISLHQQIDEDLPLIQADATRLRQVLTNLLSNAIKYNRDSGEVWLRAVRSKNGVLVSVSDTGVGLTEAQLAQLFQPFNRLGREGSGIEGTGLGLVITKRLLERMGCRLDVASRPGEGSTFSFELTAAGEGSPLPVSATEDDRTAPPPV